MTALVNGVLSLTYSLTDGDCAKEFEMRMRRGGVTRGPSNLIVDTDE